MHEIFRYCCNNPDCKDCLDLVMFDASGHSYVASANASHDLYCQYRSGGGTEGQSCVSIDWVLIIIIIKYQISQGTYTGKCATGLTCTNGLCWNPTKPIEMQFLNTKILNTIDMIKMNDEEMNKYFRDFIIWQQEGLDIEKQHCLVINFGVNIKFEYPQIRRVITISI